MKYIIFTTANCKWCDKAKALLILRDLPFLEVKMEKQSDYATRYRPSHLAFDMWSSMGFKTVPQVFKGPHHIGGFEELSRHLNT